MFDKLKTFFRIGEPKPFFFPFAQDPVSEKPSVTLLFAYVSYAIAVGSLIALHFYDRLLAATGMSFLLLCLMVIFYLIRKLQKAKIDLKNESLDLENDDNTEEKK